MVRLWKFECSCRVYVWMNARWFEKVLSGERAEWRDGVCDECRMRNVLCFLGFGVRHMCRADETRRRIGREVPRKGGHQGVLRWSVTAPVRAMVQMTNG